MEDVVDQMFVIAIRDFVEQLAAKVCKSEFFLPEIICTK